MNAAIPLQYAAPPVPGYSSALVRTHSKLGLASFQIALGFPLLLLGINPRQSFTQEMESVLQLQ